MLFSYNWLQDYLKGKLPRPEKLAELLTLHFAEVEEVKRAGRDWVLNIDVRPNRAPDCFSHWGIAREAAALTNSKFKVETVKLKEAKDLKTSDLVEIGVKNPNACLRYTARVLIDPQIGPSPDWLKERLEACGLQAINNLVDVANYVMLETGQPLHAFDLDKIESINPKSQIPNPNFQTKKIIIRFAKKGEKIITLDDKKYVLDKDVLVIADHKKPIGIAGIKGELTTGIDKNTKTVLLESANFEPRAIRKGARLLNLKTDASWRFEHGLDPNLTEIALDRAAQLMGEIAGAKIARGRVDFYPRPVGAKKIKFDLGQVEGLLGIKIPKREIIRILKSLEFIVRSLKPGVLEVGLPTFRQDVSIPEDLIEEVGRIYGYGQIPAIPPRLALVSPAKNWDIAWEELARDALKESGLGEVYNYSLMSPEQAGLFGYQRSELLELENPLSENYQYLVPSLIPNLLQNAKSNLRYFNEARIFELGKTFKQAKGQEPPVKVKEGRALAGLVIGENDSGAFYELKGIVDVLLEKMGIAGAWYDEYQPTPEQSKILIWNLGKSAEIKVGDREIGFLGEISFKILSALKIKRRVMAFDLDFEGLQLLASEEREYRPASVYPAIIRDIAILVPLRVRVSEVLNIIEAAGGALVVDVDIFDIYQGEEILEGRKNLAFHLVYQAEDRTLMSEEADQVQQKIIKALEENSEWEVRK